MTSRVGVIGGGQLARMMIPPAIELGIDIRVLAEANQSSASLATTMVGDYRDLPTVLAFAEGVDVLTFDHEHVPLEVIHALESSGALVRPGSSALVCAQDKGIMRERLGAIGIPIPEWTIANNASDVEDFLREARSPIVAKTPRGGYDGKGVRLVSESGEVADWMGLGGVLLERRVAFTAEVAQLVARRPSGDIAAWPLVETVQNNGVCSEVRAPVSLDRTVHGHAREIATLIAEALDVTGVLAVEMFVTEGGGLLVNELAMRPHNSGHIFTELSETSQFEQHLRAILDWPLGSPSLRAQSGVMVNIFGGVDRQNIPKALSTSASLKVHDYGKEARPGRKAGHVSITGDDQNELLSLAREAVALCAPDGLA